MSGSRSGGTCGCRPPRRSRPVTRRRGSPSPRPSAGTSPGSAVALRFLAAAVAYSRVHTGVHYPGDVVVGSLIGEGTGQAVAGLMDRLSPPRKPSRSGRGEQCTLSDAADAEGAPGPAPGPETGLSRPISIRRAASGVPPGGRRRVVRSRHGPARRAPAGAEGCRGGSPPGPTGPTWVLPSRIRQPVLINLARDSSGRLPRYSGQLSQLNLASQEAATPSKVE